MLPEATAIIKTQHTCCGWVHAAGGSWGTWKWKTQPFLNCSRGTKKQYSAESFPSLCLSVAHPHPWSCLSLEKMTAGFLRTEIVPYLSNAEIFQAELGLYCHTQLVFGCVSYTSIIPRTHRVAYAGGWGVGDPIPAWGWNHRAAALPWSCRTHTPGMGRKNPGHTFVSYAWTVSMKLSGRGGLGCSSGLGENLTKHLMGLEKFDFSEPQALVHMATSNITAVPVEKKLKQMPQWRQGSVGEKKSWPQGRGREELLVGALVSALRM